MTRCLRRPSGRVPLAESLLVSLACSYDRTVSPTVQDCKGSEAMRLREKGPMRDRCGSNRKQIDAVRYLCIAAVTNTSLKWRESTTHRSPLTALTTHHSHHFNLPPPRFAQPTISTTKTTDHSPTMTAQPPAPTSPPAFLTRHLPPPNPDRPHITLTWAQSLDAKIAGKNGSRVILSGPESMLMTHWWVGHLCMWSPRVQPGGRKDAYIQVTDDA